MIYFEPSKQEYRIHYKNVLLLRLTDRRCTQSLKTIEGLQNETVSGKGDRTHKYGIKIDPIA